MNISTGIPIHIFIREARRGNSEAIRATMLALEEMGYWGVTIPDHILSGGVAHVGHEKETDPGWRYADPFSLLAYLAASTTSIKLIPRVIVVPYRQPFAMAHALSTIDSLSGGRLVVGVAAGYERTEFEILRIPRNERGRITDEYLAIMRELWSHENVQFEGRYYSFENASLLVRPVQQPHPPLWIGGNGPKAVERAVRIGNAWTPNGFVYPEVDPGVPNGLTVSQFADAVMWSAERRAANGQPPLEYAMSSGPPLRILTRSNRSGPRPRSAIDRFTCEGTPDELLEEYAVFKDAGATSFVVNFSADTVEEYLDDARIFAHRVMPYLG